MTDVIWSAPDGTPLFRIPDGMAVRHMGSMPDGWVTASCTKCGWDVDSRNDRDWMRHTAVHACGAPACHHGPDTPVQTPSSRYDSDAAPHPLGVPTVPFDHNHTSIGEVVHYVTADGACRPAMITAVGTGTDDIFVNLVMIHNHISITAACLRHWTANTCPHYQLAGHWHHTDHRVSNPR